MSRDGLRLLSLRERKKQRDLSEIKRTRWFASTQAGDFGEGLKDVDSEIKTLTIAYQPHTASDFGGFRAGAKVTKKELSLREVPTLFVGTTKQSGITLDLSPGFPRSDLGRRLLLPTSRPKDGGKNVGLAMTESCVYLKSNFCPEILMKSIIAILVLVSISLSQEAYKIPFASKGNTIELTVANTSPITATQVSVEATGVPSWVSYSQKTVTIDQLNAKSEKPATFSFSIDKMAAVNKEETLTFTIKSKSGESWTKEIKIKVAPPEKFELFQNYPNPFNPTTTICYQLTRDSKVQLKVYNLLGQEVVTLVDGEKQAGYHQEVLDATRFASGMYIYRIIYNDESGKQSSAKKTMLVLK